MDRHTLPKFYTIDLPYIMGNKLWMSEDLELNIWPSANSYYREDSAPKLREDSAHVVVSKLQVFGPEDQIFSRVISDISIVLREATFTISDSIEVGSPVKFKIARTYPLSPMQWVIATLS